MTTSRLFISMIVVLLSASIASAQLTDAQSVPGISFTRTVPISLDDAQSPHFECRLAVNPIDSANLIAVSDAFHVEGSGVVVYASHDHGMSWSRGRLEDGSALFDRGGDPDITFDSVGNAYLARLTNVGAIIRRSADGGRTWGDGATLPGGLYDREFLVAGHRPGKQRERLYAAGTLTTAVTSLTGRPLNPLGFAFSDDAGETYLPGRTLTLETSDIPSNLLFALSNMVIASDGRLIVPFTVAVNALSANPRWHLQSIFSDDGGASFSKPTVISDHHSPWREPEGLRHASVPIAAIDRSSGKTKDRIYVAWVDNAAGTYNVNVVFSNDEGVSWSAPVIVNDGIGRADAVNATVAVNGEGIVGVSWYDRRGDKTGLCYQPRFAASSDGGRTFSPSVALTERLTCPDSPPNWTLAGSSLPLSILRATGEPSTDKTIALWLSNARFPNGGDTMGLIGSTGSSFHVVWADGENEALQLRTAQVVVDKAALKSANTYVTDLADILVVNSELNAGGKQLSFTVCIQNQSSRALKGPFALELWKLDSQLDEVKAVGADNGVTGPGALWRFGDRVRLGPGEQSPAIKLIFNFAGDLPTKPRHPLANISVGIRGQVE